MGSLLKFQNKCKMFVMVFSTATQLIKNYYDSVHSKISLKMLKLIDDLEEIVCCIITFYILSFQHILFCTFSNS